MDKLKRKLSRAIETAFVIMVFMVCAGMCGYIIIFMAPFVLMGLAILAIGACFIALLK